MYLCSALHGQATSLCPGASGAPTECTHGTNAPSVPSTSNTARPMRVMMPHVDDDVRAVGDLDADVRDVTADRPHRERHDVHRAAAHAAVEQAVERLAHLRRRDPVVGRTGILLAFAADERAVLDARDVGGSDRARKLFGPLRRIEPCQRARGDHLRAQPVVFRPRCRRTRRCARAWSAPRCRAPRRAAVA